MKKNKFPPNEFQKSLYPLFAIVDRDGEYVVGGPMGTFKVPPVGMVLRTDTGAKSPNPRPATRAEVSALVFLSKLQEE